MGDWKAGLTGEETYRVRKWRREFGVEDDDERSETMVAARAAWERDPVGGAVTIDPFKALAFKARTAATPASAMLGVRRPR